MKKQWWRTYEKNNNFENDEVENKFIDEIDLLKITIAFLAASNSFISFINDEKKREDESEKLKQYLVILIRITILSFSINYKWPLIMCATISIIISISTRIYNKLSIEKEDIL